MKKIFFATIIGCIAMLAACDDDHIDTPALIPPITDYIAANYPNAKIIDNDLNRGNVEVEIVSGMKKLTLLFTPAGIWQSTINEDVLRSEVPLQVINAVTSSPYGTYIIDDIEYWQTVSGDYYLFELKSGITEVYLKVSDGGTII